MCSIGVCGAAWQGGDEGTWKYQNTVVNEPEDWARLAVLNPTAGSLGAAREAVTQVCAAVGDSVPVLMTIFSPLSQAKNLAGPNLLPHLRHHPDAVLAGLEIITETILRYVERAALNRHRRHLLRRATGRTLPQPYGIRALGRP